MKNIKYYWQFKEKLLNHLGNKCFNCGTPDNLEIDHVNPEEKEFNVTVNWSYSWEYLLDEIEKCQLLCEDCHKRKHMPEHGTLACYTHRKCRCDLCKAVWNEKTKEYKLNRKNKLLQTSTLP